MPSLWKGEGGPKGSARNARPPSARNFQTEALVSCAQVDGKHQAADVEFARLHIDIQHLDLSKTPAGARALC